MATTYLQRIVESGSTGRKWTFSVWFKLSGVRSGSGAHNQIWNCSSDDDSTKYIEIAIKNTDKLDMQFRKGTSGDNGTFIRRITNRVFRDQNAWYHVVMRMDTTQSSAGDRFRVYVNGVQETSFDTSTGTIPLNYETEISTTGSENRIGRGAGSSSSYWDGSMSHLHFCDDYSYAPTEFGETDSTTGEWKIKTAPSVSYGTNGFFIFKDGTNLSGSTVQDQSGEGHNLSLEAGTLTPTKDCPSNNFATLSPDTLPRNSGGTVDTGNLFFGTSAAQWTTESSAFGIANGKYYFEVKLKDNGGDRRFRWGLQKNAEITKTGNNKVIGGTDNNAIGYATQGESATQGSYFINQSATTMSDGDINEDNAIYGYAIDLDNQRMYGHMNGTWFHSGNPSAGSGGIDVSSFYTVGDPLFPSFTTHNSNLEINFGNGYFGTTAVATNSGNGYQDADGNGVFNYTVPTNYRALCTKGLNQ